MTSKTVNGTTTAMMVNAADQLTGTSVGGQSQHTYNYDGNGNMTAVSAGDSFAHNAANQTTSITPFLGSAIPMSYLGTDQARRITSGTTSWGYDHTTVSSSSDSSTGSSATYVTTPNGG